jgi:hypothetical protein
MLHRVALVRTDVSEKRIASIIKAKRIREVRILPTSNPDYGGDTFFRNVGYYKREAASHPRRQHFYMK